MVSLAIFTSQNSYITFIATIESFYDKCENIQLINEIIHIDDRSCEKNRNLYINLIAKFFPTCKLTKIYADEKYYTNDSDYLHNYAVLCEKFRKIIIDSMNKYVFMLEDDWFFCKSFDLNYFYNILENTNSSQVILTTVIDLLNNQYSFNFTKSKFNNFFINDSLKLCTASEKFLDKTYWLNEVFGYQFFSQNPNLTRIDFFKKNGEFDKTNHFEYEYNKKAYSNNLDYNLLCGEPYAYHIGSYKKYLK